MAPRLSKTELARRLASQRARVELTCVWCGSGFTSYEGTRYCTDTCRQAAYYQENKDKLNAAASDRQKRARQRKREAKPP